MYRPLRPTTGSRHQCTSRTWQCTSRTWRLVPGTGSRSTRSARTTRIRWPPRRATTKCRSRQDYQDGHHDDRIHDAQHYDDRPHGGDDAGPYYQDDAPLEPHEDEMYDDAPHARRHSGLVTALALIGCAVLGTAGAYAYRSYSGVPSSTQPPPVIAADNSTPTKIVPATAGDPQSSKAVQDRLATAEKEQLVSKQEEPVALSAAARPRSRQRPRSRRHRRGSVSTAGWRVGAQEGSHRHHSPGRKRRRAAGLWAWPRRRRREQPRRRQPRRPDRPPRARARTGTPPARSSGAPIALEPQAGEPAAAQASKAARQRPYRLPPRARPMDSSCSFRHRRRRARRNPPSAACRQSSPTSLAAASRSFGERIWAAKACSTAP